MAIDIELDMSVDPENEISMTVDDGDEVEIGVGETIVVKDHAILDNRDLPDQHPISAITGLAEALAESGKINTVKVNGTALPIVDKAVDVPVPTKVSEIEDDLLYYLGTIYPDASTNMFSLTQEQHSEILAMIHRAGNRKCYLAFDYAGESYTLPSAGLMNYRGVLFYIFQEYNPGIGGLAGSMFVIGIATNMGIGGMILVHLLTEDDVQTSVTGTVNGDYIIDRLGYTPVNPSSLATVATTGSYNDLTDKPTIPTPPVTSVNGRTGAVTGLAEASSLATVATTGDYDDLIDKPTIPTKTSDLTNDSGFVTHDNQVEQSYISNISSYTYWRGLAIGANAVSSESGALSTTTDKVYVADAIRVQPSTGTIKATTFKGDLTGTASGNLVSSDLVAITTAEIDALFV